MNAMLDKLARQFQDELGDGTFHPGHFDQAVRRCMIMMQEPSEAMLDAGARKARGGSPSDRAYAVWRAMISEMLKEPGR